MMMQDFNYVIENIEIRVIIRITGGVYPDERGK
jgi:hypothetical protein